MDAVVIKEVGPRDGLQNESSFIPTQEKLEWMELLVKAGVSYLEVTSFVNPSWIPALKDADEVMRSFPKREGLIRSALVPNQRGLERALETGVDEVAVFLSASETHNRKNINKTIDETLPVLKETVLQAKSAGLPVRGYVSTVFGCPYEGTVSHEAVIRIVDALFEMGVYEVSLGDTIGVATPHLVGLILPELLKRISANRLAMHFHDTRGMAIANIWESYRNGIRTFDASCGGLGGCPYAPGASGNVATEDVLYLFEHAGIETGLSMEKLTLAAEYIQERVGRRLPSRNLQAAGGSRHD